MRVLAHAWIAANRLRRRRAHYDNSEAHRRREELVRSYARGRSFVDVGCMWGANARFAFLAEDAGATQVTGLDGMGPTDEYLAEHERRSSAMRFVQGDLHDPATIEEVGPHDVAFCNAVIYHSPSPFLLLQHLHRLTNEYLLLGTHTMPEVPGIEQACVFYPGISEASRAAYKQANPVGMQGISTPFDPTPIMGYGNFWWGLSHSALYAMLEAAGFEIVGRLAPQPFYADVVARKVPGPTSVPPAELARQSAAC
jgi:SAM-dependent methyltransferase